MISVNEVINNALQKCSLIGDSESADGTIAKIALKDLHDVITDLNENDYLQENQIVKEVKNVTNKIVIVSEEDAEEDSEEEEISESLVKVKVLPSKLISVSRKVGNHYIPLIKTNKELLYATNRLGLGRCYTTDTVYNEEKDRMEVVIEIDSNLSSTYVVILNAGIPEYEITDYITLSNRYKTLIEDGLCYKLAIRYKLSEYISVFNTEYESSKYLVMRNNNANRPMVYERQDGMLDNYYNTIAGEGW